MVDIYRDIAQENTLRLVVAKLVTPLSEVNGDACTVSEITEISRRPTRLRVRAGFQL